MINNTKMRNSLLLVLTAFIWGTSFVAQSEGGDAVGPFTFNGIRSIIGGLVLLPVIIFLDKKNLSDKKPVEKDDLKKLIFGGVSCGMALFLASSCQQVGIYLGTPAGKAGFLTACYIIVVPILGLFLKKKCGWNIWAGMLMTVIGLYMLCMTDKISFNLSDLIVLVGALIYALHIMIIDYFSPSVDGVRMSCIQFFVCGVLSLVPMFWSDMKHSIAGIIEWLPNLQSFEAWVSILYAGVLSCGVAYTLQIIAQNGLNPTLASMLMSLESVFSVLAGWIVLGELLSLRQLIGCGLIFAAIIFAQIPVTEKIKERGK